MAVRCLFLLLLVPLALLAAACGDDEDKDCCAPSETPTEEAASGGAGNSAGGGSSTREAEGENESVFDLQVGDCFNDDSDNDSEESEVEVIDCGEPHDNEVYFEYEIEDGDFPGENTIILDAEELCVDEFENFVGIPFVESELVYFPVYPTEASWEAGDRIVYCVLYAADFSKLTGTAEGSQR